MSVERAFEQIRDAEKRRRVSQIRAVQPLSDLPNFHHVLEL